MYTLWSNLMLHECTQGGVYDERERLRKKKKRIMISNNNLFTLFKDKISSGGTNHSWKRLKILNPKCGMFLEQGRDYKLYIFLYRKHKRQYYYTTKLSSDAPRLKCRGFFLQRGKKRSFPRHLQIIANRDDRLSSYIAALTEKRYRLKSTRGALFSRLSNDAD